MTDRAAKPRVYVRAANHTAYFEAKAQVPREVREHVQFIYLGDPGRIRRVRNPMVWRADGWEQHPTCAQLDVAEAEAMSSRWSWPPADLSHALKETPNA